MNIQRLVNGFSNRSHSYLNQRRGWTTDRKIVVIESDDWGGIRMPNREVYEKCLKAGIRVNESHYNKYDTLASREDFEHLYSILSKYEDMKGNPPSITANTIVANPDFESILNSDFTEYYYETFIETMKRYDDRSFDFWQEGISKGYFFPQLHGREHLNVERWLRYLKKSSKELDFAFKNNLIGLGPLITNDGSPSFVRAFDQEFYLDTQPLEKILTDACKIFEEIFGYKSLSFIAPNYIWSDEVEKCLSELGVKYFQGATCQNQPNQRVIHHFLGKKNHYNQTYLLRNVVYEPSSNNSIDWNKLALKKINMAFKHHRPAVICTHRVNFIGSIFEDNRTKNLKLLDQLLHEIKRLWPEVEFMNSVQLGNLIEEENI